MAPTSQICENLLFFFFLHDSELKIIICMLCKMQKEILLSVTGGSKKCQIFAGFSFLNWFCVSSVFTLVWIKYFWV